MTSTRRREISRIVNTIRLIKGVHERYSRDLMKRYGITGQQLWALRTVASTPHISLGELSERMYLHISTGSGIVDRLEARRYLVRERSLEDRRVVQLRITPRGRQVVRRVPVTGFLALMQDINRLPSSQIHRLGGAMKILLKVVKIQGDVDVGMEYETGSALVTRGRRGKK